VAPNGLTSAWIGTGVLPDAGRSISALRCARLRRDGHVHAAVSRSGRRRARSSWWKAQLLQPSEMVNSPCSVIFPHV